MSEKKSAIHLMEGKFMSWSDFLVLGDKVLLTDLSLNVLLDWRTVFVDKSLILVGFNYSSSLLSFSDLLSVQKAIRKELMGAGCLAVEFLPLGDYVSQLPVTCLSGFLVRVIKEDDSIEIPPSTITLAFSNLEINDKLPKLACVIGVEFGYELNSFRVLLKLNCIPDFPEVLVQIWSDYVQGFLGNVKLSFREGIRDIDEQVYSIVAVLG